ASRGPWGQTPIPRGQTPFHARVARRSLAGPRQWGLTPVLAVFRSRPARDLDSSVLSWSCDREGRALAPELHVDGIEGALLRDLDQRLARELEAREEAHHQQRHAPLRLEELRELDEGAGREASEDAAHVSAHRELLPGDAVVLR